MRKLLIVGLPFFPHKYQYLLDSYKNIDVNVKVLLNAENGGEFISKSFDYAGKGKFKRIYNYLKILYFFRPKNIDCYDYSILSIVYILIARLFGINVRFWLIGGELIGDKQDFNKSSFFLNFIVDMKMHFSKICLRFANVIYAKEHHHIYTIKKINPKLLKKVEQIYNCVPVSANKPDSIKNGKKDFLYANAVIEKRNVISLIQSLSDLRDNCISFSAAIYGFSSISNDVYAPRGMPYSEKVLDLHNKLELNDCVKVYGFVKNIKEIMTDYRFFVLPADVILANYALLEAMSLGLVPIVYPGNGYEVIVEDGVNGIVAKDYDLTKAMKRALSLSQDEYVELSDAAYSKIKNDFSLNLWQEKLSKHIS